MQHVAGPPGSPAVPLVLLRPTRIPGPWPLLYHLHGGGLVTGTAHDDVPPVVELAAQTGCAVASVEYRLAPEAPYPAARPPPALTPSTMNRSASRPSASALRTSQTRPA